MKARAVFLDRDGVINRAQIRDGRPYPPDGLHDLEILPGVDGAVHDLQEAGLKLVVVTNQPDVARGQQSRAVVEAIHAALKDRLKLDDFRVCYHDDDDRCGCRKPAPGLLVDAARDAGIDLAASFVVGDRWRDIEAGRRAGCRTLLIDCSYGETLLSEPDVRVRTLRDAARWILDRISDEEEGKQ